MRERVREKERDAAGSKLRATDKLNERSNYYILHLYDLFLQRISKGINWAGEPSLARGNADTLLESLSEEVAGVFTLLSKRN